MHRNSRADVYLRLLAAADELAVMAEHHETTAGQTALRAGAELLRVLARAFFAAL